MKTSRKESELNFGTEGDSKRTTKGTPFKPHTIMLNTAQKENIKKFGHMANLPDYKVLNIILERFFNDKALDDLPEGPDTDKFNKALKNKLGSEHL